MSRDRVMHAEPEKILVKHAYWFVDEMDQKQYKKAQERLEHMLHLLKSFFPRETDAIQE